MNKYAHLENYVSELRKTAADYSTIDEGAYKEYCNYMHRAELNNNLALAVGVPSFGLGVVGASAITGIPELISGKNKLDTAKALGKMFGLGAVGYGGLRLASHLSKNSDKYYDQAAQYDPVFNNNKKLKNMYNKLEDYGMGGERSRLLESTPLGNRYLEDKKSNSWKNKIPGLRSTDKNKQHAIPWSPNNLKSITQELQDEIDFMDDHGDRDY